MAGSGIVRLAQAVNDFGGGNQRAYARQASLQRNRRGKAGARRKSSGCQEIASRRVARREISSCIGVLRH